MNPDELDRLAVTLKTSKNFLEEIRKGDLELGVGVAGMLLSEGPDFDPELLMVLVESVVELSAQAGSKDAQKYLEQTWPVAKKMHLKRFLRRSKSENQTSQPPSEFDQ